VFGEREKLDNLYLNWQQLHWCSI